jgi:hypothetical protein
MVKTFSFSLDFWYRMRYIGLAKTIKGFTGSDSKNPFPERRPADAISERFGKRMRRIRRNRQQGSERSA